MVGGVLTERFRIYVYIYDLVSIQHKFHFQNHFFSSFNLKRYWKIDFSSFWHDLGFGGGFFLSKIQLKKYLKIVFSSFWHVLVLMAAFSFSKFNLKSIKKLIFLSFWHDLGFGGSFFLFKI